MIAKHLILIVLCFTFISCGPNRQVNTIFKDPLYAQRVKAKLKIANIEFKEESDNSIWYSEKFAKRVEQIKDEVVRNLPKYFIISNLKLKDIMVDGLNKKGIPFKIENVGKEESKIFVDQDNYEKARKVFKESLSKLYSEP